MARQFSPKSFLRQASNKLIRRYLEPLGVGSQISWEMLREVDIEPVFEAIGAASDKTQTRIETDFRDIDALADWGGRQTLIDEGRFHNIDLAPFFADMNSDLDCSLWTLLEHPRVFLVAKRFDYADNLTFEKRAGLPDVEMQPSNEAKAHMREALSEYYRKEQGRGQGCQIDHYIRGPRHYYFCYLEDYAETRQVYQNHKLSTSRQRPAFDVILIYDPLERTLESKIAGGKAVRAEVERIFGRAMLGVDLGPPPDKEIVFDLQGLMDRAFEFPIDPEDGLDNVTLRRLKLRIMGRDNRSITLEVGAKADGKAIWDLLDQILAGNKIPRELLVPVQASIRAQFRRKGGRAQSLSFNVSYPNSCTLKADPKDEILKHCLKRWKIDLSGRDGYSAPQPRLDAQYRLWRR